ncbi:hypothetical protein [Dyadobacter jejuensis]|nr:hypothetical protein [Dyadobacter jejuensis]
MSERAWFNLRNQLVNDWGVPIAYCTIKKSYYYREEGSFVFGFKKMPETKKENLKAGGTMTPVGGHGEMFIDRLGAIQLISFLQGHYRPSAESELP